jgi:hypothetical protein
LEADGVSLISNGGEFGSSALTLFGDCGSIQEPTVPSNAKVKVEQFYCRVLQRPPESDAAIVNWLGYLKSNTFKDLVRVGILRGEFIAGYVTNKSDAAQAATLYDVLLARAADSGGLTTWTNQIALNGWAFAVMHS